MKQLSIVIALVAALALVPAAQAGSKRYATADGDFSAKVKFKDGKPKQVKAGSFKWSGVPARCQEGDTVSDGTIPSGMKVKNKRFRTSVFLGKNGEATVEGRFRKKGKRIVGTFKASFVNLGGFTNCTVDELGFRMKRK